jgi:hypothetical protein
MTSYLGKSVPDFISILGLVYISKVLFKNTSLLKINIAQVVMIPATRKRTPIIIKTSSKLNGYALQKLN